jgi:hypothetical protein
MRDYSREDTISCTFCYLTLAEIRIRAVTVSTPFILRNVKYCKVCNNTMYICEDDAVLLEQKKFYTPKYSNWNNRTDKQLDLLHSCISANILVCSYACLEVYSMAPIT